MKINQPRLIKKIVGEIYTIIDENFDESGMFKTRCPIDHFDMFRSLLEIRFVSKNADLDLQYDWLNEKLSSMASVIRFLRLGDGGISNHTGLFENRVNPSAIPNPQIIDTSLSIVDIKQNETKIKGFDRLSTKKSTVIISTEPTDMRSKFNNYSKPGINIFDFEASFGTDRLINRSDICVISGGYCIKLDRNSKTFFKKTGRSDQINFIGETQVDNKLLKFALRREITIFADRYKIVGNDFIYMRDLFDVGLRLSLNQDSEIREINQKSVAILLGKSEYIFTLLSIYCKDKQIEIHPGNKLIYPSIEVFVQSKKDEDVNIMWSIEKIQ
jgi:hypothetical protein